MSVKMNLSSSPSVILPSGLINYTIDWSNGDVFSIDTNASTLTLNFSNATIGKEIILKITNTSPSIITTIKWPFFVAAEETTINPGITKIFKLTKLSNKRVICTTEVSINALITYNTAGSYNLTIPSGVTKMNVTVIPATGGGGGGGGIYRKDANTPQGWIIVYGGGGGGGGYASVSSNNLISVTSGSVITINVGQGGSAGGAGGDSAAGGGGGIGQTTTIMKGTTTLLSVAGGQGGIGGNSYAQNTLCTGGAGGAIGGASGGSGISPAGAGGAGGTNPDYPSSKGGNGGSGGSSGNSGTSAVVLITYS